MARNSGVEGGAINSADAKKRNMRGLLIVGGVVGLFGIMALMMDGGDEPEAGLEAGRGERLRDLTARNPSDRESWDELNQQVQRLQARLDEEERKDDGDLKDALNDLSRKFDREFNALDEVVATQNTIVNDLERVKRDLRESPPSANAHPMSSAGLGEGGLVSGPTPPNSGIIGRAVSGPVSSGRLSDPREVATAELGAQRRKLTVISLGSDAGEASVASAERAANGDLSKASEPEVFDTTDYVPPNAYAPARVLVAVNAAVGKQAQADPQAAAFVITGDARHVEIDGVIATTSLKGCIVNGAARGDLSTERVYIKLAKMTCPLSGGRVSVQDVEGHVTQLGKAGVRGRIVSRVGDQLNKATIAGALSGLGNALGGASRGGIGIAGGGGIIQEVPDAEELAIASAGSGVANAADQLATYYIDQARNIEPVVEMPAGAEVELVFINGAKVRPTDGEVSQ